MTEAERQRVFESCERYLWGHRRRGPRQVLAALVDEVGDDERADFYGAGKEIEDLEADVARLLGKPAALFLPSGTMAQQIALRIHAEDTGCPTVAFHPTSHLELHEQRGYGFLHGLDARLVGARTRLIEQADLDAITEPLGALLLELPQREIGGQLPTWDALQAQLGWARERGVRSHLDGARLWETRPFYERSYAEICAGFDTVYVSFYKILDAIAGAALVGPEPFIERARIWRRRHGGTLITQFPCVVSARAGLREHLPRISEYCARATAVAEVMASVPGISVSPKPPHTNMFHAFFVGDAARLMDAVTDIASSERVALFRRLRPTEVPGVHATELTIGTAALDIGDDELGRWFRRLMEAA